MKTLSRLLLAVALTGLTANTALAYQLSPPGISAKLRGTLTFYSRGGQQPFKCKVTFDLKTKGIIKAASVDTPGGCNALFFGAFPWFIGVGTANTGQFGPFDFSGGGGTCNQGIVPFQVNSSGIWTLPQIGGSCIAGTMTSSPPVTIVP